MKNYYQILGVSEDADRDKIRDAYRELAKTYHPDSNSEKTQQLDTEEKNSQFRLIDEAWKVLKDPDTRNVYDQTLQLGREFNASQGQYRQTPPKHEDPTLTWDAHDYAKAIANNISNGKSGVAKVLFEQMLNRASQSTFDPEDISSILNALPSPAYGADSLVLTIFSIADDNAKNTIFLDKEKFAELVSPTIHHGGNRDKKIHENEVFLNHFKEYNTIMDVVSKVLSCDAGSQLKTEMVDNTIDFWKRHPDIAQTDGSSHMHDSLLEFSLNKTPSYSIYNLREKVGLLSENASEEAINICVKTLDRKFAGIDAFNVLSAIKKDTETVTPALRMNFSRALSNIDSPKTAMLLFDQFEQDFRLNGTLGGYAKAGNKLIDAIMLPIANERKPDRPQLQEIGDNLKKVLSSERFIQEVGVHHFVNVALDHMSDAIKNQVDMITYGGISDALNNGARAATTKEVGKVVSDAKKLTTSTLPILNNKKSDDEIAQAINKIDNLKRTFFEEIPEKLDTVSRTVRQNKPLSTNGQGSDTRTSGTSQGREEESYVDKIIREFHEKKIKQAGKNRYSANCFT